MNYYIKEVEKEDLYDYMYVSTYAWNETYKGIMSDEYLDNIKKNLNANVERLRNNFDQTKKEEPDYKRFILYINNKAAGVFGICKSREENYPLSGELCNLYLLNMYKGLGYGKIMFNKAKEELINLGFKDMIIYCIKENPTNGFYKHMGGEFIYDKKRNIGGKDLIENVYYYNKL